MPSTGCSLPPSLPAAGTISGIGSACLWHGSDCMASGAPFLSPSFDVYAGVASGGERDVFDLNNDMHCEVGGCCFAALA